MTNDQQPNSEVSRLLIAAGGGDKAAANDLLSLVYDDLKAMAQRVFRERPHGQTLQPTAVVHEAWLKVAGSIDTFEGRRHFLSVAAKAMRQVVSNHARAARRLKRGGERATIVFDERTVVSVDHEFDSIDLIAFDDALDKLSALNERHARVAEMRLLGSMTIQEIADELGVSKRTVESDWNMAQAWLVNVLS